jgi:transcriptional regulator with XRE-family HTH domain
VSLPGPHRLSTLHTPRHWLLCQRLRAARKRAGLTQAQAASALGHPQNYVSKCERAQRKIEALELADFADLYAVPMGELIPPHGAAAQVPVNRRVAEPRMEPGSTAGPKERRKRPPTGRLAKKRSDRKGPAEKARPKKDAPGKK